MMLSEWQHTKDIAIYKKEIAQLHEEINDLRQQLKEQES